MGKSTLAALPLAQLKLDTKNPRHGEVRSEREAIEYFVNSTRGKLEKLVENISTEGWDETSIPIVLKEPRKAKEYTVIDGNRRIAALKIIKNPDLANNNRLRAATRKRGPNVPDRLLCLIKPDRPSCWPYIERKHKGEQGGLGQIGWDAIAQARHDQETRGRPSKYEIAFGVLDYLLREKSLTEDDIEGFPISSLDRVLNSTAFKDLASYHCEEGKMFAEISPAEASKPIRRLVEDLKTKRIKVDDVINADKIRCYYEELESADKPSNTTLLDEPKIMFSAQQIAPRRARKNSSLRQTPRTKLASRRSLEINPSTHGRAYAVYGEITKLDARQFPNAASALFRIFLDISVQDYRKKIMKKSKPTNTGHGQVREVANHLQNQGLLTQNQAAPIITACSDREGFLSISSLSSYMHNPDNHPVADDLFRRWDSFKPFLKALWGQLK